MEHAGKCKESAWTIAYRFLTLYSSQEEYARKMQDSLIYSLHCKFHFSAISVQENARKVQAQLLVDSLHSPYNMFSLKNTYKTTYDTYPTNSLHYLYYNVRQLSFVQHSLMSENARITTKSLHKPYVGLYILQKFVLHIPYVFLA